MANAEQASTALARRKRTGEVPQVEVPAEGSRRRRTAELTPVDPVTEVISLKEQVAALEAALAVKDRRIQAMKEIGRSLSGSLNLDEVLVLIMRHVTDLLEADRSTLYVLEPKSKELWSKVIQGDGVQEIRMPVGVGVAGWVAKTGQLLNLRDVYSDKRFNQSIDKRTGYRTENMVAIPMRDHRGRILGVIQALNKKTGNGFTDEDERMLEAIASTAATAIENAVLYEQALKQNENLGRTQDELSRKLAEQDLLFEFTQSLVKARDTKQIIEAVLMRSAGLTGAEAAMLLALDGPSALLHVLHATAGPSTNPLLTIGSDPSDGLVGWVATHMEPVVVADAAKDKRSSKSLAKKVELNVKTFVGVPLIASDGSSMGSLALVNRHGGFTEEHVVMLTMLGNQSAKAIEAARIKEQDQNAQRLQTIGQMLSGVVHDFKTPMTIISGYVQLMVNSNAQEEREEFAELTLKQFENLSQMTRDLLQFARGEVEVLLRKVYLQHFITEMEELLRRIFDGSGVELVVEAKFKGTVRMDQTRMTRVVTNIARNAKEAMPDGGKFTFTVQQSGDSVQLVFADNGPGIAEELEGRLFQEFATHGKADGTGLGLAVVKRIVQEHHGDITYESKRGKGTTFTVRLPL
ncbi:MAG: GAF domain-containing sensor histidine kinase [Myxococcota bacterium]